jgi:hypothetical protein
MNQALYAHMNNKRKIKKNEERCTYLGAVNSLSISIFVLMN